ncbi:MAG: DinB family protein [Bacteroidota bacterium]
MKSENRKDLLNRLEEELDRQINVVVEKFQNLSDQQLNKPGANGGWSIAQNLQHLNLYFDYYNPTIANALESAPKDAKAEIFKSGWLGNYFTNMMDYRTNKKVKAFKDYIPSEKLNTTVVVQRFIQNEEEMLQLLRKANDYNLTKLRIAISLTKWITMRLGDVFQFVIMHNERHIVQAESRLNE